jgi:uncharacterized protein YceH (UPF0502 family)
MLRGPQTPGEIRGRSGRLASFTTVGDAEAALEQLRSKQLVVELPRRPGQKESRWTHLLSGTQAADASDVEMPASAVAFVRAPTDLRRERDERMATLEATVAQLRDDLERLRVELDALRTQLE